MSVSQRDIDLAVDAVRAEDFGRAERILQRVMRKHPRDADALHLRGVIELQRGRPLRAVPHIERALQVDPGPYFFHNNHGEALRGAGRYDEALVAFDEALVRKPDYPEALNGKGNTLRDLGRIDEALAAYHQALALRPEWPPVLTNVGAMEVSRSPEVALTYYERAERAAGPTPDLDHRSGTALVALGRISEGVVRLARAVDGAPDNFVYRLVLTHALAGQRFGTAEPWFVDFVTEALQDQRLDPATLVVAALSLLEAMPDVARALDGGELTGDVPLLRALLSAMVIPHPGLQALVVRLRRSILSDPAGADRRLASSVAMQSYDTDYVADCPEQAEVDALRAAVEGAASLDVGALEPQLLALAAYGRLSELSNAAALASLGGWSRSAEPVIRATLHAPLAEAEIAPDIPVLTRIDDRVSRAVQAHYEASPYPRWRRSSVRPLGRLVDYLADMPGFVPSAEWRDPPRVLVAGCGTGQQPIDAALAFPAASVVAIDLSRTSLAYAVRQAIDLNVEDRIHFAQGDLLHLDELEERFELVESVGVLHHMDDPVEGWRTLRRRLRAGGAMRIGLYSEKARALVVAARELIAELGLEATPADIRHFRRMVLEDPTLEHLRPLTLRRDFHDLSMCRDLLFHAHERRFDIPTIAGHLEALDLRFLGFQFEDRYVRHAFEAEHPGAWTDLEAWDAFEAEHPDTFSGMYNFFCQAR